MRASASRCPDCPCKSGQARVHAWRNLRHLASITQRAAPERWEPLHAALSLAANPPGLSTPPCSAAPGACFSVLGNLPLPLGHTFR
ncbi:hypothetical protein PG984_013560 [Apiospora sp. TS-2023a]